jgi:hypothetical protein
MQINLAPDTWVHAIEGVAIVFMGYVGMKIKQAQAENKSDLMKAIGDVRDEQHRVKEELVAKQNAMRHDMDVKHAENKADIAENRSDVRSHLVSDELRFGQIDRTHAAMTETLARIERKVDQRNGAH